jgi:N-dimethylarginine dimethylaminohydrolase
VEAQNLGRAVAARGFEPVFVDASELRRAGGGPKCCTLAL